MQDMRSAGRATKHSSTIRASQFYLRSRKQTSEVKESDLEGITRKLSDNSFAESCKEEALNDPNEEE